MRPDFSVLVSVTRGGAVLELGRSSGEATYEDHGPPPQWLLLSFFSFLAKPVSNFLLLLCSLWLVDIFGLSTSLF